MIRHPKGKNALVASHASGTPVRGFDPSLVTYAQRLSADSRWALSEGSRYFEENSSVQEALHKIVKRLNDLGIPYVVVGGLALFQNGYRRFTEDVDLLVTAAGLRRIHEELEGLGYLPAFRGSKNLRDTELGVKIEFLVEGQFPGDGKPKPVAFPNPADVAFEKGGVQYLQLAKLIELKLASGMKNSKRKKDLVDVGELIKVLGLPKDFRTELNPFVQREFGKLWREAQTRYVRLWRNKFLTLDVKNLDEMISQLRSAVSELEAMRADGVTLDPDGGTADDYAHLVTTDPVVAKKYDMHDEAEIWGDNEETDDADDGDSGFKDPASKDESDDKPTGGPPAPASGSDKPS